MLYYLKHRPLVFFFWTLIKNFQASIVEARVVQWWECFPSSKFSESSEEDDEAIEAMVEIDKFEDSLKQKEIIKPE